MTAWHDGISSAVDMMDNTEEVLPTCPQPQQQQQTAAIAA
jgi:putative transposase